MFFAWQGRGKFVGVPAFTGLFGAAAAKRGSILWARLFSDGLDRGAKRQT
ncbi:MAG: hypothetical protein LBP89_06680 [Helicobacteraceae bacterium]|nr:hypothetical protein [Helicobacteraceae bacterium]